jgi:hypothetical protein
MNFECRESVIEWMITHQIGRRNLSDLDKVPLLERKRAILERQARERMLEGNNQYSPVENLPQPETAGKVRDQLAKEIGISGKTYAALKTVSDNGTEEVKDAVRNGLGAEKAAKIAREPKEKQPEILKVELEKKKGNLQNRSKQENVKPAPVTSYTAPLDEQGIEDIDDIEQYQTAIYEQLEEIYTFQIERQLKALLEIIACIEEHIEEIEK